MPDLRYQLSRLIPMRFRSNYSRWDVTEGTLIYQETHWWQWRDRIWGVEAKHLDDQED
jgi:hypothetical protein